MAEAPTGIRAVRATGTFDVTWPDGHVAVYPFKYLRCECPCAACVNEFTGERILDPATVPEDVAPTAVEMSGNYAMKVMWSDGHYTGLYTWDRLYQLQQSPEVMSR
ncbi:MAG: DUF971 domain-containing protein [Planctomycetaceae bacterium]|nr:DUF971 domain-containing protein [Planctomycetaceae bacterium]